MDPAELPTENAHEPQEEAYQPTNKMKSKCITFADNIESSSKSTYGSDFKELLSQPPQTLTHKQRLQWLQERRGIGLWVQCDSCNSWRYLPQALDSHDLPDLWYCTMNPDPYYANCSVPEEPLHIRDEEDLIHAEHSAGSVVWARLTGWPWWPAIIDDCPDTEQFYWLDGLSDIPTHYNAVFFDGKDVSRAWIAPENLKPFRTVTNILITNNIKNKKFKGRLDVAIKQANDAVALPLANRLAKYSFIARFKGNIHSPRKIDKRNLKKYQSALKRKFNVDFPNYSSESDDSDTNEISKKNAMRKRKNKKYETNNNGGIDTKRKQTTKKKVNSPIKEQNNDFNKHGTNNEENVFFNPPNTQELEPSSNKPFEDEGSDTNKYATKNIEKDITEKDNLFKPPNTQELETFIEDSSIIDNDTSATYVPDTQTDNTFEVRATTPNSDDFDF